VIHPFGRYNIGDEDNRGELCYGCDWHVRGEKRSRDCPGHAPYCSNDKVTPEMEDEAVDTNFCDYYEEKRIRGSILDVSKNKS